MPSQAWKEWSTDAQEALAELRVAHAAVRGKRHGRRAQGQQLNYAFVLLLSARFQAYCRDLHTEAAAKVRDGSPLELQPLIEVSLRHARALDRGNPTPGNIGRDFNLFGFLFWDEVDRLNARNTVRRAKLERLNAWRNAIAHHEIRDRLSELTPMKVTLDVCIDWQAALNGLAESIDHVLGKRIGALVHTRPW